MPERPIYLDYNATTPVDPRVLEAMLPFFYEQFGNAASKTHAYGWVAEAAVKQAREQVAETLACSAQEIVFTSGATESINLALRGAAEMYARKGDHIITVATEHKAVLDTCKALERQGRRLSLLDVDAGGRGDPDQLRDLITDRTVLVSIMLANNETGVLQSLPQLAEIAHSHGALMMSDATQAVGKMPVDVDALGLDLLALSAHKCYGPKGVGALYVRRRNPRVSLTPQLEGGGHERGLRSGTLNVPGIVALGGGESAQFVVGVAVPLTAVHGQSDSVTITATSAGDALATAVSVLTTTAVNGDYSIYLPVILKP